MNVASRSRPENEQEQENKGRWGRETTWVTPKSPRVIFPLWCH